MQDRTTTATALAETFYRKIEKDDAQIGAFLTLSKERAMAKASQMDALAAKGEKLPPLGGVPVAIKDVMVTAGVRTTAGSKQLNQVRGYRTGTGQRTSQSQYRRVAVESPVHR